MIMTPQLRAVHIASYAAAIGRVSQPTVEVTTRDVWLRVTMPDGTAFSESCPLVEGTDDYEIADYLMRGIWRQVFAAYAARAA